MRASLAAAAAAALKIGFFSRVLKQQGEQLLCRIGELSGSRNSACHHRQWQLDGWAAAAVVAAGPCHATV